LKTNFFNFSKYNLGEDMPSPYIHAYGKKVFEDAENLYRVGKTKVYAF